MKLRIHNNSIRLRLSQGEVKNVGDGKPVEEVLNLNKAESFGYCLALSTEADTMAASFSRNRLVITIPAALGKTWAATEQVSLRYIQDEHSASATLILIEKDFQCLHKRPDEDESDNFPNPQML